MYNTPEDLMEILQLQTCMSFQCRCTLGMRHMINLPATIGTCTIQYGRHYFIANLIGMKTIVMPDHDRSIMNQVPEYIFSITYNGVMVMITIDENQVKFLLQRRKIKASGVPPQMGNISDFLRKATV